MRTCRESHRDVRRANPAIREVENVRNRESQRRDVLILQYGRKKTYGIVSVKDVDVLIQQYGR
jgi:hypothetical protein